MWTLYSISLCISFSLILTEFTLLDLFDFLDEININFLLLMQPFIIFSVIFQRWSRIFWCKWRTLIWQIFVWKPIFIIPLMKSSNDLVLRLNLLESVYFDLNNHYDLFNYSMNRIDICHKLNLLLSIWRKSSLKTFFRQ